MSKKTTIARLVKPSIKQVTLIGAASVLLLLSACTSNHSHQTLINNPSHHDWVNNVIDYQQTGSLESRTAFTISDEMRQTVRNKFAHLRKGKAVEELAQWLMSEDGHDMRYDLDSNLLPIDAFEQKRGNCLSFTILLVNLAKEIGVDLAYNDVHLPNIWGLETQQESFILFRHVNAIRKTNKVFQIFDLALEEYDFGFPQQIISERQAKALLNSNLAVQHLKLGDQKRALDLIKLAIALDSNNADFWINLGVIFKKDNKLLDAERAFLHALNLDDSDSLAASNLEQLYQQKEQHEKAKYFHELAFKARQKNPYTHFIKAKEHVGNKHFRDAKKSITKAKRLHKQDPRFFALSSVIEQHLNNSASALKDMLKAHQLSVSNDNKQTYSKKAILLANRIKEAQDKQF